MNEEIKALVDKLCSWDEVESVVLGGSRSGECFDTGSDYDIYVYVTDDIPEERRTAYYETHCSRFETGNHYFEYEDNCVFIGGTYADIIFRRMKELEMYLKAVVDEGRAFNGYTTCFWHNVIRSQILFDRNGSYERLQKQYTIPYPEKLRNNIIERNMKLLSGFLPSYDKQIMKALGRDDIVSVNHRTAAFMESYFDVIFAMNEMTHPGEKKLIDICKKQCAVLPENFEDGLRKLFADIFSNTSDVQEDLGQLVAGLEKTLEKKGLYRAGGENETEDPEGA